MATLRPAARLRSCIRPALRPQSIRSQQGLLRPWQFCQSRGLIDDVSPPQAPDFAFAFDIDGVLVRSADPLPRAAKALRLLRDNNIPFVLLTNGGGKTEAQRVEDLSSELNFQLYTDNFIQSHTPFAGLTDLYDKTVLVCGGDRDNCQIVAQEYGFKNVVTPGDIVTQHPEIWPFTKVFADYYRSFAKPLPMPIVPGKPEKSLKIDAVFVYNDSRDWGLDITVITDLLLSREGIMGTLSEKNGDDSLPNRGYQQDGQPPLYFSNPDLWWAAKYHLSRLGQGGFREALQGVWRAITGGHGKQPAELIKTVIGKPHQPTYEFAEKRLLAYREKLFEENLMITGHPDESKETLRPLRKVYMVGDNPESDILGGNSYKSPYGSKWQSILLKTGVYQGGEPAHKPSVIVEDVYDAVQWAIKDAKK
ncbi:hypothetical protein AAFC00_005810 [Neodothiora populina]|uniref:HAD-superfamily hydrolase n=1 Tax=Neodothiora populina TaxID=2781224 RepID=A0ABR3P5X2_9PEZI